MLCYVYKGNRKADTYLYTLKKGDFDDIPPALISLLGELEFVLSFDLAKRDRLAQVDINSVTEQLRSQGYYVQMPPGREQITASKLSKFIS